MLKTVIIAFIFLTACNRHALYADDLSAPQSSIISMQQLSKPGSSSAVEGTIKSMCGRRNIIATVKLWANDLSYTSVTDSTGDFKISHIKPGTYTVSATLFGHSRLKDTLVHLENGVWQLKIGLVCIR